MAERRLSALRSVKTVSLLHSTSEMSVEAVGNAMGTVRERSGDEGTVREHRGDETMRTALHSDEGGAVRAALHSDEGGTVRVALHNDEGGAESDEGGAERVALHNDEGGAERVALHSDEGGAERVALKVSHQLMRHSINNHQQRGTAAHKQRSRTDRPMHIESPGSLRTACPSSRGPGCHPEKSASV